MFAQRGINNLKKALSIALLALCFVVTNTNFTLAEIAEPDYYRQEDKIVNPDGTVRISIQDNWSWKKNEYGTNRVNKAYEDKDTEYMINLLKSDATPEQIADVVNKYSTLNKHGVTHSYSGQYGTTSSYTDYSFTKETDIKYALENMLDDKQLTEKEHSDLVHKLSLTYSEQLKNMKNSGKYNDEHIQKVLDERMRQLERNKKKDSLTEKQISEQAYLLDPDCKMIDKNRAAVMTCSNPELLAKEHAECWQSSIVKGLYQAMGRATMSMYSQITQGALPFIMTAFAVWLAFRLLRHISSFVEENPNEVWNEVLQKLFLCFACGVVASSTVTMLYILNLIVFPIYNALLEFGSEMLNAANNTSGEDAVYEYTLFGSKVIPTPLSCKAGTLAAANMNGFPEAPQNMMTCLICGLNEKMNLGFKLAFQVMKLDGLMPTLVGFIILCCFTFVKLGFVFYLVDTIFKMSLMMIILPILILGFAFKPTRSWLGKGFLQILNSAGFMMFIAIMICMAMLAVEQIIMDNEAIFAAEDDKAFKELSIPMLCLLLICFLIISSVKIAQQVTDSLVGGSSGSSFNQKVQVVVKLVLGWLMTAASAGASKAKSAAQQKTGGVKGGSGNSLENTAGKNEEEKEDGQDEGGEEGGEEEK